MNCGKMTSDIMIHNHLIQLNSGVPRHRKNAIHGCRFILFILFISNTPLTAHIFLLSAENKTALVNERGSPEARVTVSSLRQVTGIQREPVAAGSAAPGYQ